MLSDEEVEFRVKIGSQTYEGKLRLLQQVAQTTQHFCGQCGHFRTRCLKGYVCRENGKTVACQEFIEGAPLE
jgi:predicted RNA-binding Zn-ribbon protein involved in translation (DUF1610 family)